MKKLILSLTIVFCLATHSYTEEANIQSLTLDEVVTLALEDSPLIKDAQNRVGEAELGLKETSWYNWFIPSLSLNSGYDLIEDRERFTVSLNLDLKNLFGQGSRCHREALLNLSSQEENLKTTRNKVVVMIIELYHKLTLTREELALKEERVELEKKRVQIAQIRFDQGEIDLTSLLEAKEALSRAKLELLQTSQEIELLGLRLKETIGLPIGEER